MTARTNDGVVRSVHDRLLKLAASRKEDFNALLGNYGNERILYRLSRTKHGKRFVLKGASLFILWLGKIHRPTRDLDLLGSGQIDPDVLKTIFNEVCTVEVEPDGLRFDPASITVGEIREGQEYGGLRVKLRGNLGCCEASWERASSRASMCSSRPGSTSWPDSSSTLCPPPWRLAAFRAGAWSTRMAAHRLGGGPEVLGAGCERAVAAEHGRFCPV